MTFCAYGQGTTSRLVGTVQDPSGAGVVGATVKLVSEGTNATFTGENRRKRRLLLRIRPERVSTL